MGGPTGTRRGHHLLVAGLVVLLSATGVACSDDAGDTTATTAAAPTTDSTVPVLSPDAIPVLEAAAVVPAGTEARDAVDAGLVVATTVARDEFPPDGVVTVELIEGRRAAVDIPAGTILTLAMFVAVDENGTTPAEAGVESE
jgi:hypothetical protein